MPDGLDVKFIASPKMGNNCICDCCHGVGSVLKVKMPETKYFDGRSLSIEYRGLWICKMCAEKLVAALKGRAHE